MMTTAVRQCRCGGDGETEIHKRAEMERQKPKTKEKRVEGRDASY